MNFQLSFSDKEKTARFENTVITVKIDHRSSAILLMLDSDKIVILSRQECQILAAMLDEDYVRTLYRAQKNCE